MIRIMQQMRGTCARLLLLVCLVLAHCSKPEFNNIDITGADYARYFALTDASGASKYGMSMSA